VAALKQQRVAAYSGDDERLASSLKHRSTEANEKTVELEERRAGAELASQRTQVELDRYRAEHIHGVLGELAPDMRATAEAVQARLEGLQADVAALNAAHQRVLTLVRGTSVHPQSIPAADAFNSAVRSFLRSVGEVPVPLPSTFTGA
jgi:hypothetical protein